MTTTSRPGRTKGFAKSDWYKPLTDEQSGLAGRYLPLARKLSKRLREMYPSWAADFESAACLGLIEAARTFDPGGTASFGPYARNRIRGELADMARSMNHTRGFRDGTEAPVVVPLRTDWAADDDPVGTELDDVDSFEFRIRALPAKCREVCRRYYLHGKTMAEVATEIGCSPTEAVRRHRLSIDLLSECYGPDGLPPRNGMARRNRSATVPA